MKHEGRDLRFNAQFRGILWKTRLVVVGMYFVALSVRLQRQPPQSSMVVCPLCTIFHWSKPLAPSRLTSIIQTSGHFGVLKYNSGKARLGRDLDIARPQRPYNATLEMQTSMFNLCAI